MLKQQSGDYFVDTSKFPGRVRQCLARNVARLFAGVSHYCVAFVVDRFDKRHSPMQLGPSQYIRSLPHASCS
jgi:hypothetical protein